jgi:hypothetical protein
MSFLCPVTYCVYICVCVCSLKVCVCVEIVHMPIIIISLNVKYSVFFHYYCVNYRTLHNFGTLKVSFGVVSPTNSVY